MAAPKAPAPRRGGKAAKQIALDGGVFDAELHPHLVHETVRAELRPPRRHTRREEPRPRRRRPGQAVAAEGHRPCPTGHEPRTAVDGRRRRLPARTRDFTVKVNRKERRAALGRGVRARAGGNARGAPARPSTRPRPQAAELLVGLGSSARRS